MAIIIGGQSIPNLPWEENKNDSSEVVWRFSQNPIIERTLVKGANSIFNSAVLKYEEGFVGIFRVDDRTLDKTLHLGKSNNGIDWEINDVPINMMDEHSKQLSIARGYDPRIVNIEGTYYITWCNNYNGPTIGVAYTKDFNDFYQLENAFLPFNRNGVLFPRKINDKYVLLSRPSDNGHTPFGDIFLSESPDMVHWGCHKHVMAAEGGWSWTKVGAGPIPIETNEGWLLIYHGVQTTCNGLIYSMGAALLDIDNPSKVLYRSKAYILAPQTTYECVGDVPNVIFPCASLVDQDTGRIAIYYGAADTVVALAFTEIDRLLEYIKANN